MSYGSLTSPYLDSEGRHRIDSQGSSQVSSYEKEIISLLILFSQFMTGNKSCQCNRMTINIHNHDYMSMQLITHGIHMNPAGPASACRILSRTQALGMAVADYINPDYCIHILHIIG